MAVEAARSLLQQQRLTEAVYTLQMALHHEPSDAAAQALLGASFHMQGELKHYHEGSPPD